MPKAVYRSISKGFPEYGQGIVWISGSDKTAAYTDKQAKKYLLCESCESKFSKKGEEKVLSLMARPNGFKLQTKINKFKKLSAIEGEAWYFSPSKDFALGFLYFAVSIAWRVSSTEWGSFGLPKTKGLIRDENMVSFSDFLLGKTTFPRDTYLAVYVDSEFVDTPTMGFPTVKNHDGYQHIVFNIPGLKFSILAGTDPGSGIRETFTINESKVYFVSRSLKSHPDYKFMVDFLKNGAVAKGRLRGCS